MTATQPATTTKALEIKLAHSPDSDDAFMFYALATNRVKAPGLKFTHVLADIETLNQAADRETYDVTAISFSAYAFLREKYVLLDCGASFGEGYGPIVVASRPMKREELAGARIGVPGLRTSAYLTMRLFEPKFEAVPIAFDQIIPAVRAGTVDAGLLIHEGQLHFPELGMHKVVDLGQWWQETTKLPLPLGGNAVRRALGPEIGRQHLARHSRERGLRPRTSRGSAQLRHAVRPRHGPRTGRQVRGHVRQQVDAGLRRARPRRRAVVAGPRRPSRLIPGPRSPNSWANKRSRHIPDLQHFPQPIVPLTKYPSALDTACIFVCGLLPSTVGARAHRFRTRYS